MVELKQCPFCGASAFLTEYNYEFDSHCVVMHVVECNGCHATTFEYDSKKMAIDAWNKRVT